MSSSDIAFLVLALIGMVGPWVVVIRAFGEQSRMTDRLSGLLGNLESRQAMVTSELLAHRTLAETGNQAIAGMMLQHSNAHDRRADQMQMVAPPAGQPMPVLSPEQDTAQGPHVSPEILWSAEDEQPPVPGEG